MRGLISKPGWALAIIFLDTWLFGRKGRNSTPGLVCHVMFSLTCILNLDKPSSTNTKSLSRKGRLNLTAWWRRSLSTAGAISLISAEHYPAWTPRGVQGEAARELGQEEKGSQVASAPSKWQGDGASACTLALQMGNKQLSSYSCLQWAWPGERGHRWKGLSEIHAEQPCCWTSQFVQSSVFCWLLRQRLQAEGKRGSSRV